MEENHKRILGTFRMTTKYKNTDGKSESIDLIIQRFRISGYTIAGIDGSKQDLIENIHPFLFMNYVLDWAKIPSTRVPKGFHDGKEFGLEVIRKWQDYCWKNKIWNYDSFKIFKSYNDLQALINKTLGDSLYYIGGDYFDFQIKLTSIRQEEIDEAEFKKEEEAKRLEEERELLIAENKAKEAQKVADELRRKKQAEENEKTAQFYKDMQNKPNSPYSRDDQDADTNSPFMQSSGDILEEMVSPFEVTSSSFLSAPVPEPNSRQLILKKSTTKEGFEFVHGSKVPKNGVITPRNIDGTLYMCWERTSSNTSTMAMDALWKYYKASRYISFTLRDNVSQNPDVTALPITSIVVDGNKK